MRAHHEADERQRIVHLLVREVGESGGAVEHLGAEDLAGLVSGSLLKTELGRVENHLLACEDCRERAIALQNDFEAGVVPILLRRPTQREDGGRLFGPRIPRRWTPWILGAAAAVLAVVLPLTELLPWGSSRRAATERYFVVKRLGNPQIEDDGGKARPAAPGGFIDPGEQIEAAPGDYLAALRGDGSVVVLTEGKPRTLVVGDLLSEGFFARAQADRRRIREQALDAPKERIPAGEEARIIHPLDRIHSLRPVIRWGGETTGQGFEIRLYEQGAEKPFFRRREEGFASHWPDEVLSLEAGRRYRVELRPLPLAGDAVAKADFEVIGGEERAVIERELARIEELGGPGPSMLRAEYFRQRGLPAEAREELERLRRNDSENVDLLMYLKAAYHDLGLRHEESRTATIVRKRL